jgi:3-phosphoshikimate 1-carboxyvinyltransferase
MKGRIEVKCSKSIAQRYMILSYLAGKNDEAINIERRVGKLSEDVAAMKDCLESLIETPVDKEADLGCKESGTTLRILMPVIPALGRKGILIPEGSLADRPIAALEDELVDHGATIIDRDTGIFVKGPIEPGEYRMSGNVSSQYTSGLLIALAILDEDSSVYLDARPQSMPYIEMTMRCLELFGVKIEIERYGRGFLFKVPGDSQIQWTEECTTLFEGDWSNGSMWLAANYLLNDTLEVRGLSAESLQGDRKYASILSLYLDNKRKIINIDVGDTPDVVPAIALVAATSNARTIIQNAGRLRFKESDRLYAIAQILKHLGAKVTELENGLQIEGTYGHLLKGSDKDVETYNDHRMVMLAAFLSIVTEIPVKISNTAAVAKSYPDFFEEIIRLGGRVE